MKFILNGTCEAQSIRAADDLFEKTRSLKNPLICPASGDSPAGLYKMIVQRVREKKLDISDWFFVGLDEWAGMNGDDEGSCRYHLDQELFHPLQIPGERICFFDGRANGLEQECQRVENFIQTHHGIDIAILGLGMNGHVGMNEPGTSPGTRSHVAELHRTTQQVAQKYFRKQQQLTRGLTLGLATLMESKHVMLLVNGEKKAEIVQRVFEEDISSELPASFLRRHPSFDVYLDAVATKRMQVQVSYE
jgi:galactosamine-6-phosphate isomerase